MAGRWVTYGEGKPRHDIAAILSDVKIPAAKRTARVAMQLLKSTKLARSHIHKAVTSLKNPPPATKQLLRQLRKLGERLDAYGQALAAVDPDGPIPASVLPLLYQQDGSGFITPDFIGPYVIGNQLEQLEKHVEENQSYLADFLDWFLHLSAEAFIELDKAAAALASKGSSMFMWVAAGGVVVLGLGAVAYGWSKGKSAPA